MNEPITKKSLIHIGFESEDGTEFRYDVFGVRVNVKDIDNPLIWIDEKLNGGNIAFPGAYTLKDLKDLMFFYYGENEYGNRFAHLPIEIVTR